MLDRLDANSTLRTSFNCLLAINLPSDPVSSPNSCYPSCYPSLSFPAALVVLSCDALSLPLLTSLKLETMWGACRRSNVTLVSVNIHWRWLTDVVMRVTTLDLFRIKCTLILGITFNRFKDLLLTLWCMFPKVEVEFCCVLPHIHLFQGVTKHSKFLSQQWTSLWLELGLLVKYSLSVDLGQPPVNLH